MSRRRKGSCVQLRWQSSTAATDFFQHRRKLDETTMALKKTSKALEIEKHKTEDLLHEMMPKKIAKQLTSGHKVKAGESNF